MSLPRVGISACLLGQAVRYDGGHKRADALIADLAGAVELVPVCPEVGAGLGTPREPMHLAGDPAAPRLLGNASGIDHTAALLGFARAELERLAAAGLAGFVLKSGSPSCGAGAVQGLFARALAARFPGLPIAEELELGEAAGRARFVARVSSFHQEHLP